MAHKLLLNNQNQPMNRMSGKVKHQPTQNFDWQRQKLHDLFEEEEDDGYFSVKGSADGDFSDTNSVSSNNSVSLSDRSMDTPLYFRSEARKNDAKKVSNKTLLSQIEILVEELKKYPAAAMVLVTALAVVVYLVFCNFPPKERVLSYYVTVMPPDCSGNAKSSLNMNKVMSYVETAAHTGIQAKRDAQYSSGDVKEKYKVMNNVETEVHTGTQAKTDKWKARHDKPGVITSFIQYILLMLIIYGMVILITNNRIWC
ncbi:uncharacterized protein LOC115046080 isoform X2 [Echeneis naucrates]|uniref:uncharacterized protein LOC115046080 isoform X2 n=1 Tax=Echeneis naucrates TaxID=173247 RepID=UPI00111340C4|nr:uncharacterized protein LOC115046080 isoform X2 [Echeneis naucrates]